MGQPAELWLAAQDADLQGEQLRGEVEPQLFRESLTRSVEGCQRSSLVAAGREGADEQEVSGLSQGLPGNRELGERHGLPGIPDGQGRLGSVFQSLEVRSGQPRSVFPRPVVVRILRQGVAAPGLEGRPEPPEGRDGLALGQGPVAGRDLGKEALGIDPAAVPGSKGVAPRTCEDQ